jgi:hypothetical protein
LEFKRLLSLGRKATVIPAEAKRRAGTLQPAALSAVPDNRFAVSGMTIF